MTPAQLSGRPIPPQPWRTGMLVAGVLLAGCLAYHNSFSGVFVFDDLPAIRDNPTLRTLWPVTVPLSPPPNSGVGGRPLANLTFALNYAWGGTEVRGYHVVNLLLHLSSALLLFGIVRRTLELLAPRANATTTVAGPRARPAPEATGGAFAVVLMWTVHPLATASVSYLSQRTELLMGFFYLLTLYSFIRGQAGPDRRWFALSVVACGLGMASKEVMVTAPVLVALYDRTFLAGTFRAAWRLRWRYYVGLAATWLVLGYSLSTGLHQRSVGFGLGVSPWQYALAECEAILRYVQLTLWPEPLVFDYGRIYPGITLRVVVGGAALALALWQTAMAVRRRSASGFVAACFFLLLAPTSSFVPVADQPVAENRMYLPIAAATVLAALAVRALVGPRFRAAAIVLCVALCVLTILRNEDYRSELRLWQDTVQKRPQNARAQFNCGVVLLQMGRAAEAVPYFEQALRFDPHHAEAHDSLGNALVQLGRNPEAMAHYAEAVRLRPGYARAWYNHGTALFRSGDAAGAIPRFEEALRLAPDNAEARNNLGNAYFSRGDPARAIPHYELALRLNPQLVEAHYSCGNALLELGRIDEAIAHLGAAVRLSPDDPEFRNNHGSALLRAGKVREAIAQFEEALRLKPGDANATSNLELARGELRR